VSSVWYGSSLAIGVTACVPEYRPLVSRFRRVSSAFRFGRIRREQRLGGGTGNQGLTMVALQFQPVTGGTKQSSFGVADHVYRRLFEKASEAPFFGERSNERIRLQEA